MEFVKGIPITEFCDQENLDTRQRLELFRDVCAAVNHAHQKGIIHRDLKPSNILVSRGVDFTSAAPGGLEVHATAGAAEHPHVKVIDFGIAKAIEQKLTDKTLLSVGYDEMRRIIREVEPPRPSVRLTRDRTASQGISSPTSDIRHLTSDIRHPISDIDPDLDWIVMKALEKDRTRRYETANALSADIHRHLTNEPIMARPASKAYRFQKAFRRNKLAFTATAAVALALLAGAVVSTWQAIEADRAREAEKEQRLAAQAERDSKAAALQEAEAVSTFLTDVLQSPDPARNGATLTVAELLGIAAKKLDTDLASQPARQAKLQATMGRTYYALGLMPDAIPLQEKALDYYRSTSGPEHPDTLEAMRELALSYWYATRRDEALNLREEALALSRKLGGPERPKTLDAMGDLADSYYQADRHRDALRLREELVALWRKVRGPESPDTLDAMSNLARAWSRAGRRDEALRLRDEVLTLRKQMQLPDIAGFPAVGATLVAADAEWKWLHPTDGKDPAESVPDFHKTFALPGFDDSQWTVGRDKGGLAGGFGYGDVFDGVDIGRPENGAHRHTAYFRHAFTTDTEHKHLELRCQRDDGIIVYLDGREVLRDNVGDGGEAYLLHCIMVRAVDDEGVDHRFPLPGALAPGPHTLALSVHNTAGPGSDLYLGRVTLVEVEPAADGK